MFSLRLPTSEHHHRLSQRPEDQTRKLTPTCCTNITAHSRKVLICILQSGAFWPTHLIGELALQVCCFSNVHSAAGHTVEHSRMYSLFGCHHKPACFSAKSKQWARWSNMFSIPNCQLPGESGFVSEQNKLAVLALLSGFVHQVTKRTETKEHCWFGLGVSPARDRPVEDKWRYELNGFCYCWVMMGKAFCFSPISYFQSIKWGGAPAISVSINQLVGGMSHRLLEKALGDWRMRLGSMRQKYSVMHWIRPTANPHLR